MKIIKKSAVSVAFLIMAVYCNAQNDQTNCSWDSMEYKTIYGLMDTAEYKDIPGDWFPSAFLRYQTVLKYQKRYQVATGLFEEKDCFCSLLIYAKAFDYLLRNGLDLHYDYFKDPPYMNSIDVADEKLRKYFKDKAREHNKRTIPKDKAYSDFLVLNENYKLNVVDQYNSDPDRSLKQDVANIIRYGFYTRPETLRDILLFKYPDKTKTKFSKELRRRFFGEKE